MLLDWWSGHHLRYDSQVSRAPLGCSGWAFQAEGCPYSQWYLTVHSPWRRSWCMIIMVRHSSPSVFAFFLHLSCFRIRHTHLHGSGVFFPFFLTSFNLRMSSDLLCSFPVSVDWTYMRHLKNKKRRWGDGRWYLAFSSIWRLTWQFDSNRLVLFPEDVVFFICFFSGC